MGFDDTKEHVRQVEIRMGARKKLMNIQTQIFQLWMKDDTQE
jgi:hypothetical protein